MLLAFIVGKANVSLDLIHAKKSNVLMVHALTVNAQRTLVKE